MRILSYIYSVVSQWYIGEVKQFNCNHLIKEEKDQEKIMRTPVTATRTGDEFYVGNNGEANQSKYPIELRTRLTRKNLIMHV